MICGDPAARKGSKWLMLHVALTEEECRWLEEIPTFGVAPPARGNVDGPKSVEQVRDTRPVGLATECPAVATEGEP